MILFLSRGSLDPSRGTYLQQAGAQQAGAGAQAFGASQQAGAQQLFSQQGRQQASLHFSSDKRQRWHFGAHSQPQVAGAQALGASQAGAQGFGASQQAGAQQLFSPQEWQQQASLAFSSANRQRWHFGAHSQPQAAGAHAAGAQGAGAQAAGAQGAGAQAAGAQGAGAHAAGAQAAGAQQLFSPQELQQQASLAFSRSKRWGRQLFGTQPQAGSQHFGASQAGAQG